MKDHICLSQKFISKSPSLSSTSNYYSIIHLTSTKDRLIAEKQELGLAG
jgi:hypothetical protein